MMVNEYSCWLFADTVSKKAIHFVEKPSPISSAKAIKNETELNGMREAHLRDSVALATTWHWIETQVCMSFFNYYSHESCLD